MEAWYELRRQPVNTALLELLGHKLSWLPVHDIQDFDVYIRLPRPQQPAAESVQCRPSVLLFVGETLLDQKHPAINIGNQEKASKIRLLNNS